MLYKNICQCCGGTVEKIGDKYVCQYCQSEYTVEKIENYAEKINQLFDELKLEMISNARKNLYNAITAQYISSENVHECCVEIKKYLPDDFQANFYGDFINKPKREVAQMIRKIDVKADFELLESLIVFVAKSLEKSYVAALKDLIERAYKLYKSDMPKYVKYITMVENEAEKLDKCMYDTKQPRKAFVAYSSKDSDKAIELVEVLESQGISCFISLRNLRHGVGSQENYLAALKEAMDNCMSFVFVSSMNSRNIECDAVNIEIPYIKQCDKSNAPGNLRNYYKDIPQEYKKPRVEYRIEESAFENFADGSVDEFFDGYERAYTIKDVGYRIIEQSSRTTETVQTQQTVEAPKSQTSSVDALIKRIYLLIEDGEFSKATELCEQALNSDPENAEAYICELLIEFNCRTKDGLSKLKSSIKNSKNYIKVLRFGTDKQKAYVKGAEDSIQEYLRKAEEEKQRKIEEEKQRKIEEERCRQEKEKRNFAKYLEALKEYESFSVLQVQNAKNTFIELNNYKDSKKYIFLCEEKIDKMKKEHKKLEIIKKCDSLFEEYLSAILKEKIQLSNEIDEKISILDVERKSLGFFNLKRKIEIDSLMKKYKSNQLSIYNDFVPIYNKFVLIVDNNQKERTLPTDAFDIETVKAKMKEEECRLNKISKIRDSKSIYDELSRYEYGEKLIISLNGYVIKNNDKIKFGLYPQTKVTDIDLINLLNAKSGELPTSVKSYKWKPYKYYIEGKICDFMWYIDIEQENDMYRGVYFTSYRPWFADSESGEKHTYQFENGYKINTVYWFKYEPISWTVLCKSRNNQIAVMLCDMIIDAQPFQNECKQDTEKTYKYFKTSSGVMSKFVANDYLHSTIREWLDTIFYRNSFTINQKKMLYGISLLSYYDVINSAYGFSDKPKDKDIAREMKTTDYAQVQGGRKGSASWLLKTCTYRSDCDSIYAVNQDGSVDDWRSVTVVSGIVPTLSLKL